jgi:hypothetical protein
MHELDHDIRVWLTAEQYAGLVRAARADEPRARWLDRCARIVG